MNLDYSISKINYLINFDQRKSLLEQSVPLYGYTPGSEGFKMREESEKNLVKILKTWDSHDWLEFGELTTGILGMLPIPGFNLAMNALSIGFGAANAAVYAAEGDNYSASIALGLALIPGPSTYKLGKQFFAKEGSKELLQKVLMKKAAGKTLTKSEQEILQKGLSELSSNSSVFNATLRESVKKSTRVLFNQKGLDWTFKFLLSTANKPIFKEILIPIYGATVGVDSLYYLYTLTQKPEDRLTLEEKRIKSEFKPLVDLLKNPALIISLISNVLNPSDFEETLEFESLDVSPETLNKAREKLKNRKLKQQESQNKTEGSTDKWIDNVDKGLWLIQRGTESYEDKKGYEGITETIKLIQNKLGITPNGVFDKKMEESVKDFQKNNGLTIDGKIGPKTIKKLNLK